jgi:hypothetical protein
MKEWNGKGCQGSPTEMYESRSNYFNDGTEDIASQADIEAARAKYAAYLKQGRAA